MARIFNLPFIAADESWLTLLNKLLALITPLATMLGIFYGIFSVIPNFVRQKQVEHMSLDAKEAWKILPEVEVAITKLYVETDACLKHARTIDPEKHQQLQIELLAALNRLHNALLLLRRNVHIRAIADWIERLEKILQYRDTGTTPSLISLDLLVEFGVLAKHDRGFQQLALLRDNLIAIYEMRDEKTYAHELRGTKLRES